MSRPYIPISTSRSASRSVPRAHTPGPSRIPSPSLRYLHDLASSFGSGSGGSLESEGDRQALVATRHTGYNTPDYPSSPRLGASVGPATGVGRLHGSGRTGVQEGKTPATVSSARRGKELESPSLDSAVNGDGGVEGEFDRLEINGGEEGRPRRLSLSPHQEMSYTERAEDEAEGMEEGSGSGRAEGEAAGLL